MKDLYIKDMTPGQAYTIIALVTDFQPAIGKGPCKMKLTDVSGSVPCKCWDCEMATPEGVYAVTGNFTDDAKYGAEFTAERFDKLADGQYDAADFEAVAVLPIEELRRRLEVLTLNLPDHLRKLVVALTCANDFDTHPAAVSIHHGVKFGLLQHSIEVAGIAYGIAARYNDMGYGKINIPIIVTGALVHDAGKTQELYRKGIGSYDFTKRGGMVGHVGLGLQMITDTIEMIPGFPEEDVDAICHLVAAHHGSLEHDALVEPRTKEALIVHLADLASAGLYIMDDAISKSRNGQMFVKTINGRVYVPEKDIQ